MTLCSVAIAAGVVGVFALMKRIFLYRRRGLAFAGCGPGFADHGQSRGRWGGPWSRRWHGGGPGRSFWLRALFERLDTTPGQEREIRSAIEELQRTAREAANGVTEARGDIARAVAGETFDEVAVSDATGRVDTTTSTMKEAVTGMLRRVHAVLDPRQRERLAELLEKGPRFSGRWGNPYRDAAR